MSDTTVTGSVVPQSAASTVIVHVPASRLMKSLQDYWDQVKDRLDPNVVKKVTKGGYRTISREKVEKLAGGLSSFYRPVLLREVTEYMKTQDRQPLAYDSIKLLAEDSKYTLTKDTTFEVQATVYLEPEVVWKKVPGDNGEPLQIKVPKVREDLLTEVVDAEIRRTQESNTVLVPTENAVQRGHVVVLDCNTVIDGVTWAPGTFTNNKWLVDDKLFKVPGLIDQLVGMRAGEDKVFATRLPEEFDEALNGGSIDAVISLRVNQVYSKEAPEVNDDLAITAGFKSLDAWKTSLLQHYTKILSEEKQNLRKASLVASFVNTDTIDVSAVPSQWLANKAKSIYDEYRDMARTEAELLAKFCQATTYDGTQVRTKEDLLTYFAQHAAQMLVEDLVFRSYGKSHGIEGDTSLNNVAAYANVVRAELLKKVEVVEVDPNQLGN